MNDLQTLYTSLTNAEAKKLTTIIRAKQGNLKACSERTGLSAGTLKRAKDGCDILPENAEIIREKLLSASLQTV